MIVGTVYCGIMRAVLSQPVWPGYISAAIYVSEAPQRLGLPLGTVDIENKPLTSESAANETTGLGTDVAISKRSNTSQSLNDDKALILNDAAQRERPWLDAFTNLVFFALRFPSTGRMLDTIRPIAHQSEYTTRHIASGLDATVRSSLTVSRYAGGTTWRDFLDFLERLVFREAAKDTWEYGEGIEIRMGGRTVVRVVIEQIQSS